MICMLFLSALIKIVFVRKCHVRLLTARVTS